MQVTLFCFWMYLARKSEGWNSSHLNLVFTAFAQDSLNQFTSSAGKRVLQGMFLKL